MPFSSANFLASGLAFKRSSLLMADTGSGATGATTGADAATTGEGADASTGADTAAGAGAAGAEPKRD